MDGTTCEITYVARQSKFKINIIGRGCLSVSINSKFSDFLSITRLNFWKIDKVVFALFNDGRAGANFATGLDQLNGIN